MSIPGLNKIYQTDFTNVSGNCLQACVASILNCDLYHVPNFVTYKNWKEEYVRFWESKNKIVMFIYTLSDFGLGRFIERVPYSGHCILAVDSFLHPGKLHAVVGLLADQRLSIVHDPNPQNYGRTSDEYVCGEIDLFF